MIKVVSLPATIKGTPAKGGILNPMPFNLTNDSYDVCKAVHIVCTWSNW